jgi:hypothetical protein
VQIEYLPDLCQVWPGLLTGSAITPSAGSIAGVIVATGPKASTTVEADRLASWLVVQVQQNVGDVLVYDLYTDSRQDSAAARGVGFWTRHPSIAGDSGTWELSALADGYVRYAALTAFEPAVLGDRLTSGFDQKHQRATLVGERDFDPESFLEAFVEAPRDGLSDPYWDHGRFTRIVLAVQHRALVLEPWFERDVSVGLYGPTSSVQRIYAGLRDQSNS